MCPTPDMHQYRSPMVATTVPNTSFHLIAEVSSDSPDAIGPVLEQLVGGTVTETPEGFHVDSWMEGADSRGLNRELLSALRRVERRTTPACRVDRQRCDGSVLRLRAERHTSSIARPIWRLTGLHVHTSATAPYRSTGNGGETCLIPMGSVGQFGTSEIPLRQSEPPTRRANI